MADKFEHKKPVPPIKQQKLRKGALPGQQTDKVPEGITDLNPSLRILENERAKIDKMVKDTKTIEISQKKVNLKKGSTGVLKKTTKSNLVLAGLTGNLGKSLGNSQKLNNS